MNKLNVQERKIVSSHAFAQLLPKSINADDFADISYCPLQLIDDNLLLGHLASGNAFINAAKVNNTVKAIFSGPHGYISPRWHSEQVVPTWNYVSISLTCELTFIEDANKKLDAMRMLSEYFDPNWNFNEFHQEKNQTMVNHMLGAITVFTLEIKEINSKFKLSQNRSLACRQAFQENLRLTGYNQLADIQLL